MSDQAEQVRRAHEDAAHSIRLWAELHACTNQQVSGSGDVG